jgi:hypothetical protein
MAEMRIHWKIERMDEGEEQDPRFAECLLEIKGRIECGGRAAGEGHDSDDGPIDSGCE